MRVGIDFDNTIAGYDRAFLAAAHEAGLLPAGFIGGKREVRNAVRCSEDGEAAWMRLQGRVYGALMDEAEPIAGVQSFIRDCIAAGNETFVISHKTRFGHFDPHRIDLRAAAMRWMTAHGFFDPDRIGLARENVFFEDDRANKLVRVRTLGCTHFIDDLPEVFREPSFPNAVQGFLLTSDDREGDPAGRFRSFASWEALRDAILGG